MINELKIRRFRPDDSPAIRYVFFVCAWNVLNSGLRKIVAKWFILWVTVGAIIFYRNMLVWAVSAPLLMYLIPATVSSFLTLSHLIFDKDFRNLKDQYSKSRSALFIAEIFDFKLSKWCTIGMVGIIPANINKAG